MRESERERETERQRYILEMGGCERIARVRERWNKNEKSCALLKQRLFLHLEYVRKKQEKD